MKNFPSAKPNSSTRASAGIPDEHLPVSDVYFHFMSIVTRTGDNGYTGLVGGSRAPKSDPRLHAIGTVDELNATLGAALAESGVAGDLRGQLQKLQHLLFRLGADLASPMGLRKMKRIEPAQTRDIERWIKLLEKELPPLAAFILPGGTKAGSALHLARTVCRRAERWTVALSKSAGLRPVDGVNPEAIIFLNRLGDYLFLAARKVNKKGGVEEQKAVY